MGNARNSRKDIKSATEDCDHWRLWRKGQTAKFGFYSGDKELKDNHFIYLSVQDTGAHKVKLLHEGLLYESHRFES